MRLTRAIQLLTDEADLEQQRKTMTATEAIQLLTDEAERQGGEASDTNGIVRALVLAHGLSFEAWLCVCCELADRRARREGFKDQFDKAIQSPGFQRVSAGKNAMLTKKLVINACRIVGAKIRMSNGNLYLKYDAHGEVYCENLQDVLTNLEVYKSTHPAWTDVQKYLQDVAVTKHAMVRKHE